MSIATSSSARPATPSDPIAPALLRAWRQTRYEAAGCAIRIGSRPPDALFDRVGAHEATLVTAWNPRSRRMPPGWNRARQRSLRERLRRFAVIDAAGTLGSWHEAMLLIGGDPRRVIRLARCYRQHAVVVLRRGRPARLSMV